MKKIILIMISVVVISIFIITFLFLMSAKGKTSGSVSLFVDGKKKTIDSIPVEFSFTDDSNGSRFIKNSQIKNNRFNFNKSEHAIYSIRFSIEPSLWGGTGQAIQFETGYFCAYSKAITEFDMQINIVTEKDKTIEFIASEGNSTISSNKLPIDSSGMNISVYIPSP